jgi:glycerophosphoryl diester phosphodiesterase
MIRIMFTTLLLFAGSPVLAQSAPAFGSAASGRSIPVVIAHRGASGERPEHTRAAYDLAIDQGADVIEPDLVMSRDGFLVVRHENEISETTDVADRAEYSGRRTTRTIDGRTVTGWFTEDFTLAELRTLRARERLPQLRPDNRAFDGAEPILTFEEVIDIARAGSARTGRTIGVAPELKHPTHFAVRGLEMTGPFVRVLRDHGLTGSDAAVPVMVQCFEVATLVRLEQEIDIPRIQLMAPAGGPADQPDISYAAMATPEGLAQIATYATAIGVETTMIEPRDAAGAVLPATNLIDDARANGLKVIVWTFRAENIFLPQGDRRGNDPAARGDLTAMLKRFYAYGVDAVFSDFPAVAVQAREP